MDLMPEAATEVDASYLDLTSEELVAVCAAFGSNPPLQVVGPEAVAPGAFEAAARVGWRSLTVRGLAREVGGEQEVSEFLAAGTESMLHPVAMVVLSSVTVDDRASTWLYVDESRVTVMGSLGTGIFRMRQLPVAELGPSIAILGGLDGARPPSHEVRLELDLAEVDRRTAGVVSGGSAVDGEIAEAISSALLAERHAEALVELVEGGGTATSVVVLRNLDGAAPAAGGPVNWFVTAAGEVLLLEVDPDAVLVVTGVHPDAVLDMVRTLFDDA